MVLRPLLYKGENRKNTTIDIEICAEYVFFRGDYLRKV